MKIGTFLIFCVISGSVAQAQSQRGEVVVAYRIDTPAFSRQLADGSFDGLFVNICDESVARAGYVIADRIPVEASNRFAFDAETPPDLICDPTTITHVRAEKFDFSPIVFIANSSFLTRGKIDYLDDEAVVASPDCTRMRDENPRQNLAAAGMVGDTTANGTYNLAQTRGLIGGALDFGVCTVSFDTHSAGMDALCSGEVSYYFGDIDILRAHLLERDDCQASFRTGFFAYEPYAFIVPSSNAEFRQRFISALYSLYSDGNAVELYRDTFDKPMSGPLEMLFRINNIPIGSD
jgi:ABC-type amino acid transport substrate-binding protein